MIEVKFFLYNIDPVSISTTYILLLVETNYFILDKI